MPRILLALLFAGLLPVLAVPLAAEALGPLVGKACKFEWTEPQTNEDGSALTDLAEYRIYISQTSGTYGPTPAKIVLAPLPDPVTGSVLQTACPTGIPDGQNYAVATAVDTAGNESVFSVEAPFDLDTIGPGAPIQLMPKK